MHKMIKSVLEKIEQNGYEAYLVGGFVRDSLLGIKTTDIDICTNALPKDLATIFEDQYKIDNSYGVIKIINDKFNFDITTYRKESKYVGHKPGAIEYINNLLVD
ncbi:MAG TPA: CCA tRNA nucleotidyltransferase, partial [Bacilli bacterium]|nr:CCA tRNA nucleotidyltransferase [Bacilli bacterium]